MKKEILSAITLAILAATSTAHAEYMAKIPLEMAQGGHLENGSIQIIDSNSGNGSGGNVGGSTGGETPVTPEEPKPESRCVAYKQTLIEIASAQSLPVEVRYVDLDNHCVLITKSIAGFSSLAKLRAYAKSISELNLDDYEVAVLNLAVTRGDNLISTASTNYTTSSSNIWYQYQYDKSQPQ
ncbi:hypothetical protein ACCE15_19260 [Pseudomonas parafulva]|uniref:hypothetical protein n=1 Tax=Pseudomonas parafulva TaxID=157782 RepID=UPI003565D332